jgi:hypothetical protein
MGRPQIAGKVSYARKFVAGKKGKVHHPEIEGNLIESGHEESEVM